MSLYQDVTNIINSLHQKLLHLANQDELIHHLQMHRSYICQSEALDEYIDETRELAKRCLSTNKDNERLNEMLNDQLDLLARLALTKHIENEELGKNRRSRVGYLHQKLAEYRQYLTKFDDQIRLHPNLPKSHKLYERREKCLFAINNLEEKINRLEWRK